MGIPSESISVLGYGGALLVLAIAGFLLYHWLVRKPAARAAAFAEKRGALFSSALAGRGLSAETVSALPEDLPLFGLPARLSWRALAVARARRGDVEWWLVDVEIPDLELQGWNAEVRTNNETSIVTSRHTLVLRRSAAATLPSFQLLPDLGALLRESLDEKLRDAGLGASPAALWLAQMAEKAADSGESGKALDVAALTGHYRATGDEVATGGVLSDARFVELLLNEPGSILAAEAEWLLVGRNVAVARGHRDSQLAFGLAFDDEIDELLAFALAVSAALSARRGGG